MTCHTFEKVRVEIAPPVEIGRAGGRLWFPNFHRFDAGRILCAPTLSEDKGQGEWPVALFVTEDAGARWRRLRDLPCYGMGSVPQESGRLLMQPYELWPLRPGARREAAGRGTLLSLGAGGDAALERVPVRYLGFPRDIQEYNGNQLLVLANGPLLRLPDGRLHGTLYGKFIGDELYSLWSVVSADNGLTWEYQSTIAPPSAVPVPREGANEADTVLLPDGRLLCLFRVLARTPFWRSLSADLGRTWSAPVMVENAGSVLPRMLRLENDRLLLSGGREGLFLWLCADDEGKQWRRMDLGEHHNAHTPEALRFPPDVIGGGVARSPRASCTFYTALIGLGANEALLCYDRLANGWGAAPGPHGEQNVIFCVRIRVDAQV